MIAQLMQEHNGCLIFMDMDNLKKINDIYGHKAGDRALKALGALLSEHIGNLVGCRFGGDEFLLFVPDAVDRFLLFPAVVSFFVVLPLGLPGLPVLPCCFFTESATNHSLPFP